MNTISFFFFDQSMLIVLEGHNVHMHFLVRGTQYPVHILQARQSAGGLKRMKNVALI